MPSVFEFNLAINEFAYNAGITDLPRLTDPTVHAFLLKQEGVAAWLSAVTGKSQDFIETDLYYALHQEMVALDAPNKEAADTFHKNKEDIFYGFQERHRVWFSFTREACGNTPSYLAFYRSLLVPEEIKRLPQAYSSLGINDIVADAGSKNNAFDDLHNTSKRNGMDAMGLLP